MLPDDLTLSTLFPVATSHIATFSDYQSASFSIRRLSNADILYAMYLADMWSSFWPYVVKCVGPPIADITGPANMWSSIFPCAFPLICDLRRAMNLWSSIFDIALDLQSTVFPCFQRFKTFNMPYFLMEKSFFGLPNTIGKLVRSTFQLRRSIVDFESFYCLKNDWKNICSFSLWIAEIPITMMILYMKPAATIGILLNYALQHTFLPVWLTSVPTCTHENSLMAP